MSRVGQLLKTGFELRRISLGSGLIENVELANYKVDTLSCVLQASTTISTISVRTVC